MNITRMCSYFLSAFTGLVIAMVVCGPALASTGAIKNSIYSNTGASILIAALNKSSTNKVRKKRRDKDADNYLVKQPDENLENYISVVINSLSKNVKLKDNRSNLLTKLDKATRGQKAIYAVYLLHEKVSLGGFYNYLTSNAANLIPEAKKGLVLIGATNYLNILNKTLIIFADDEEMLDTAFDRKTFLDSLSSDAKFSVFEEVDYKFESLEEDNMLTDSMLTYIDENPKQFFKKTK